MANLEFEGAIENISEEQLKFIREVLENRGFSNTKINVEVLGVAGDNYIAYVKRITVVDADGKPFKMIAKIAPSHEQLRITLFIHEAFINEATIYTEILPKFRQLQLAAEVPKSDILRFPECFGCLTEGPNELILLEDLKESEFMMLDRFKPLSNDCVRSVLKNIAILHSLSYALKHKEPQKFNDYANKLFDLWSHMDPKAAMYFKGLESISLKLIGDNEKRASILKRADISGFIAASIKLSKIDVGTKHSIIQQGDTWTNNIMFKFDGDTLLESIMIDYQAARENSPVYDILYLILNCTDHQSRMEHYYDWIDYYHKELDTALSNYGLKAAFVYPKDKLDADLKRYGKLMFSLCINLGNVMTLKSDDAQMFKDMMEKSGLVEFDEQAVNLQQTENILLFKTKIEDLIDSCVEFGLL